MVREASIDPRHPRSRQEWTDEWITAQVKKLGRTGEVCVRPESGECE